MADLSITAANVLAGGGATTEDGRAGATITAGQVVYKAAATGLYGLADCDSATAEVKVPRGIALHGASANQPLKILTAGDITIGGTLTPGSVYYLSPNPGGIGLVAEVLSGDSVAILGYAKSASVLHVDIQVTGVTL